MLNSQGITIEFLWLFPCRAEARQTIPDTLPLSISTPP